MRFHSLQFSSLPRGGWPLFWALCVALSGPLDGADKSGVGPSVISLPQGPGSVEGLGESFQPTLNTGTAKYSIALRVPPGPAGHAPSLSLKYDGGGGNGCLGFGWTLPVPHIQHRTDRGMPLYPGDPPPTWLDDWSARYQTYVNDLREELVPSTNNYFFCKNEGAFIRYQRVNDHWEARLPEGTLLEFGRNSSARLQETLDQPFRWLLERQTDTRGNTIIYTYTGFAGPHDLNQAYLQSISYGPGAPPWDNFHFIRFEYEPRPDWFEDCRSGFVVRTGHRMRSIVIGTQGPDLDGHLAGDFNQDGTKDYLVRRYDLGYETYAGTNTHWSLLGSVQLVGADDVTRLPPSTFGYTVCDPPDAVSAESSFINGSNEPPLVMDDKQVELVDMNADGLPDILQTSILGDPHQVYLNLGLSNHAAQAYIQWTGPLPVGGATSAANLNLESEGTVVHLSDMSGDGLADLVYKSGFGQVYYYPNERMSWGEPKPMSEFLAQPPPSPFGLPNVRSMDLDFDKRMDIIQSVDDGFGGSYLVWFNLGERQYSESVYALQEQGFNFEDTGVQISDFNGDRLSDLAHVQATGIAVTAGLGYGRFASSIFVTLPDAFLDLEQLLHAKLTDVTGDGLADLIIDDPLEGMVEYWVNMGNYTMSSRKVVTNIPVGTGIRPVIRWADLNGNGTTDLIYADSDSTPRLQVVDIGALLGCAPAPNMLTVISNGIGRVTLLEYRASTEYAREDAGVGRSWPDPMPFPVQVVASVTTLDSLGHSYLTRFVYHDGYYDPEEKQFRGFARVEQVEVGDATAPTLITHHGFDTGRNFEAMKGKLLFQAAAQENGLIFWQETNVWTLPPRVLWTGTNGQEVQYVHPTAKVRTVKELGQGTERRLEFEMDYDRYGNQVRHAEYGMVEDGDRSAFDDERITTTEYALNLEDWLVRFPSRMELADETGEVLSRTEYYYDDGTFSGGNFGGIVMGNLTLQRDWHTPDDPGGYVNSVRTRYSIYGNPVVQLDPLAVAPGGVTDAGIGHLRELRYDELFHTWVTEERLVVGGGEEDLVFEAGYDAGHGVLTMAVDFNRQITSYEYDGLGRLTSIVRPGDTEAIPTIEYEYALAMPYAGTNLVNYVETRQLDRVSPPQGGGKQGQYFYAREYRDGMGRVLMTKAEAEPLGEGEPARVVVSQARTYGARGKLAQEWDNCFSVNGTGGPQGLGFENIEDESWEGSFHVDGNLVTMSALAAPRTIFRYDAQLREVRMQNQDGTWTEKRYEPLVQYNYDEEDAHPDSVHYDTPVAKREDGLGRVIERSETVRLTDEGLPGPGTTWTARFRYDLLDNLRRTEDAQGNIRTFIHDGLSRRLEAEDPDSGRNRFRYDAASNLVEIQNNSGQTITFIFDGANRILSEDYHDEQVGKFSYGLSPEVEYHYDVPSLELKTRDGGALQVENTRGRLSWVRDPTGAEAISYSARGQVLDTVKSILDPFTRSLSAYHTTFSYDAAERLSGITYPDGDAVEIVYGQGNLLERIAGAGGGQILVDRVSYTPYRQEIVVRLGNGVINTNSYDRRGLLGELVTVAQVEDVSVPVLHYHYTYDRAMKLRELSDLRPVSLLPDGNPLRNTQRVTRDDAYRVTRLDWSYGVPSEMPAGGDWLSWRHDRIGNCLEQTSSILGMRYGLPQANLGTMSYGDGAGRSGREGRAPGQEPGPHALTSLQFGEGVSNRVDLGYDDQGAVVSLGDLSLIRDLKGRVVRSAQSGVVTCYGYDYRGRRVVRWTVPEGGNVSQPTNWTVYVSQHYEEHSDRGVMKHVFKGDSRVLTTTGAMASGRPLVQRFRFLEGWNLVGLGVEAPDALAQLQASAMDESGTVIEAMYLWDADQERWDAVGEATEVRVGGVLWVKVRASSIGLVAGLRSDSILLEQSSPGRGYHAAGGWETLRLELGMGSRIWDFDEGGQSGNWVIPGLTGAEAFPELNLNAGGALFCLAAPEDGQWSVTRRRGVTYYHHANHQGSVEAVSDATGKLLHLYTYLPFGEIRSERSWADQEPDDHRFIGMEKDSATGIQLHGARHYHPVLGRFLSTDPLYRDPPKEETGKMLEDPELMGLYLYALNDPLTMSDPSGLKPKRGTRRMKRLQARMKTKHKFGLIKQRNELVGKANVLEKRARQLLNQNQKTINKHWRKIQDTGSEFFSDLAITLVVEGDVNQWVADEVMGSKGVSASDVAMTFAGNVVEKAGGLASGAWTAAGILDSGAHAVVDINEANEAMKNEFGRGHLEFRMTLREIEQVQEKLSKVEADLREYD